MLWLERERSYSEEELKIIKLVEKEYLTDGFVASLIAERNNFDLEEIKYFLSDSFKPISPFGMKDMKKAVDIIYSHMGTGNKILGVVDYDYDGCNAGFCMTTLFKAFNYNNFECYMPHRQKESYGLSVKIVEMAYEKGVKLIITADNGIAAFDAINRANELGIDVVVTDHHEVQTIVNEAGEIEYNLPSAKAIVNPHQHDCEYKYKMLSGGAVVYKLSQAMIMCAPNDVKERFLKQGYKEKIISAAALSAIGDVMKILGENRSLVKQAMIYLQEGAIPAVSAIMEKPSVTGVSFNLAPHLSSVGRLSDMNKSLNFMLEEDADRIQEMLVEIKEFNELRKKEQEEGLQKALELIEEYDTIPDIIIDILPGVASTVLGLVAGKVKEKYNRPVILFSKTHDGTYKGSGRSTDFYNLFGEIEPLLGEIEGLSGGGHPAACGLSCKDSTVIFTLRDALIKKCKLSDYDKIPKLYIDKYLSIRDDFKKLYKDLSLLEPYGVGNPSPTFAIKSVWLDFEYKKKKNGEFAVVSITDNLEDNFYVDGVCWDENEYLKDGKKVFDVALADIVVGIDINPYNNEAKLNVKSIKYK